MASMAYVSPHGSRGRRCILSIDDPKICTRLGSYEILALLGTVGGEVDGARDSNFQRESIKVLRIALA